MAPVPAAPAPLPGTWRGTLRRFLGIAGGFWTSEHRRQAWGLTLGLLLLVLVTLLWGSTFAVVKELGELLPHAVLIAWRFLVASLALLPALALTRRMTVGAAASGPARPLWRDGLILGAWLIAGYGTQTIALQTTSANRAALLSYAAQKEGTQEGALARLVVGSVEASADARSAA